MIEIEKYIRHIYIKYKYKKLPATDSRMVRLDYAKYIPTWIDTEGGATPLYDSSGTMIANGYERVVIGDYGPYIEISEKDICGSNIRIKKGQEYRIDDPRYSKNVKYWWLTLKNNLDIKIYYQIKEVSYADYKPKYYYILATDVHDGK